ncbi:MAG: Bcr/CflA family drug resistance efflux transporter, partial [Alphaproteobacteria bacterium]
MPTQPRLPPLPLIVAFSILGPFSLHVVIPAMPLLVDELATDFGAAQATLTVYLVGIAGGQLLYG